MDNQTGNIGYTRRRQSKQSTTQHNILHEKDCTVRNITKKTVIKRFEMVKLTPCMSPVVKFKFIKWLYTARLKALGIPEFHICTCTMTEHKARLTHMPNMIKIKKHNTN
jgi:hypothetical protein